jgi:hypothetical protein
MAAVHARYHVPVKLRSCHTAIVDGYVIEGHVPVAEIERLLRERPDVAGVAVPDMPRGSPGMGSEGASVQPYKVFSFDKNGRTEVFARYPK